MQCSIGGPRLPRHKALRARLATFLLPLLPVVAAVLAATCESLVLDWPILMAAATLWAAPAEAESESAQWPDFNELEAAGAIIGEIKVRTDDIFDSEDPKENYALFRLANKLHINTRPGVIARQLLFKSGDPVSARLIEESERLLRANHYLYDVSIQPYAYHDGVVDIDVQTRDTWTLEPGFTFSRQGGSNSTGLTFKEQNLFGTGVALGLERKSDVDRSGTVFEISQPHAFGGRTSIGYSAARYDDGSGQAFNITRPFYEFDARWSAGFKASKDDKLVSVYESGTINSQYRRRNQTAEVFGGWSDGLIDGWVRRYTVGLTYSDDVYSLEPDLTPPGLLPTDRTLIAPYMRYEVLEDGFQKLKNRDQIERPEYFDFGFSSYVQLGRALTGLGSTENLWLYSAGVSNGYDLHNSDLFASASVKGEYGDGYGRNQLLSGALSYYLPTSKRALFFASISGDVARDPDNSDQLLIGGDNGLRGYPLRYQSGNQRMLFTVEQRVYTDWYPFRLFRVGGAMFFDVGRAWGGDTVDTGNQGWLSDVGLGLRILSTRSAFGNVLHADLAFPLHQDPNIKSVQFLFKTRAKF